VAIRALRESDLSRSDEILRAAFNTFLGVRDLFGDKDYARTRWLADPDAALAAEVDGELVGSNFVTRWGTVGFFGPLSVRPELWDQGIASRVMEATVEMFERWGTRHAGLFTFSCKPLYPRSIQFADSSPDEWYTAVERRRQVFASSPGSETLATSGLRYQFRS
jgi:predicted N-acetyltransferase YhbS